MTSRIDAQASAYLLQVPLEVLTRITYYIPTVDLANVRLTCKGLESQLFNFFAYEFFRKKQFMVSTASLQALIDISKHATLSPFLKHVIIATDRATGFFGGTTLDTDQKLQFQLALADNNVLMTGVARDMLAEAFSNLPNLEIVDIRDFNSLSRNRDGLGVPWRSFGSVTLARDIGLPLTTHPILSNDVYASSVFQQVMTALAVAGARPKNVEVLLRNRGWGLFDWAFAIPANHEQSLVGVLSNLKVLHLSLSVRQEPLMIRKFLSCARDITWLRLNFSNLAALELQMVFDWLSLKEGELEDRYDTPAAAHLLVPGCAFPKLERLDIGNADLKPSALLKTIAKFAGTLRTISLRRLHLVDQKNRDPALKKNPWVDFFEALVRIPGLNLRDIDLSELSHVTRNGFRGAVQFEKGGKPARNVRYDTKTSTLPTVIQGAIDGMTADWPYIPPPDVHHGSGDDDDDEDHEDDEDDEDDDMDDA
ncbi:hypothetical protein QBC42DRAFT_247112 [Cladorrhinum samala]|uniref:F-box domain-containing protein n=1 Tax=Cladorrhinum samala TaxID=585594 RepID=A0AAV9I2B9_9PEZI|nr:hypothetical protein QBC42DRAFT_247112 [Cladorrhinum samala]